MNEVRITATNIKNSEKIIIRLEGDNHKGYKAYCKETDSWCSPLFLRDEEERKITRRLFDGTDTTLYYLHKEDYTAIKDYHILCEVI
jgi:hypothetical protein